MESARVATMRSGSDENPAELRGRLTGRVALAPLKAAGGMVLWTR
jgi:hypothetical protein